MASGLLDGWGHRQPLSQQSPDASGGLGVGAGRRRLWTRSWCLLRAPPCPGKRPQRGTHPSPPSAPPPAWSPAVLWGSVPLLKPYFQAPLFTPGALSTCTSGVPVPGHWCWDRGHLTAMTQQRESSPGAHVPVNTLRPSPPPTSWQPERTGLSPASREWKNAQSRE